MTAAMDVDGENQERDVMPVNSGILGPENDDPEFPPIILPPFPKGWAKGSRQTLLESSQVTFSYHHAESITAAKDFVLNVTNRYLKAYYWDDPEDQEPTGPLPPPHLEALTPARKALKAAKIVRLTNAIYNWLNYRWKHPTSGPSPASSRNPKSEDPLHLLLCNIAGVEIGRLRALTFALLPADVRERYETLAKEEGKQAREAKQHAIENAGALLNPTEAQLALNRLPATLAPFLKKLGSMLGVHACLLLAGPEPQKGGQINVLSMHAGFDKSPMPLEFPEAVPAQYEKCVALFQRFVETCYTDDEMAARSLSPEELAKYMDIDDGIPDDEVDEEEERPQSKKKSKKKQKKVSESEEPAKKKGAGKKKKKKGTKMVIDDAADTTVTNAVVDEAPNATVRPLGEASNCAEGPPGMENIDPALWQESGVISKPRPLPRPSMTPQQRESYGDLPPITGPNDNPNPFAVSPEHPDAILFRSSLLPPDDDVAPLQPDEASISSGSSSPKAKSMPVPQPSGSAGDADDASVVSDALLLQPKSWKPWYQKIQKTIDALELPGQWSMVMMYLTLLEGRNKFWIGDKTTVLLATDRPKWLSHWIRCG
ncbi:uncharacterized protein ARMOST_21526 [Armillaria ostoyae]|uniref:Uncharacterized protein n=1 Tax=Armillaria ostoyae TaxID=47428 RepID=A0A284SAF6_ARMOS|nr:uncharacterized protein ARMOST_21526 [Armillaria ostoyae]